jgi:hypothetical protein
VVASACLLTVAGCAGDTKTAAPSVATAPTVEGSAKRLPSAVALSKALLTSDDLGKGWTDTETEVPNAKLCGVEPLKVQGTTKARIEFTRVSDQALIQHGVTAYPEGSAVTAVAELRRATKGCSSYPVDVKNSATGKTEQFTVAVAPLKLAAANDDRLGLRLEVNAAGQRQRTLYGVVRRGDRVAAITLTSADPDEALFARLLVLVGERLSKVAGS